MRPSGGLAEGLEHNDRLRLIGNGVVWQSAAEDSPPWRGPQSAPRLPGGVFLQRKDAMLEPFALVWNDRIAWAAGDWSYVAGWRRVWWRLWVRE